MQVGNLDVKPGVKARGFVETGGYADAIRVRVPVLACCGQRPGPTLAVVAGQHGRELNGVEAIRRVFDELRPETLAGTFLAAPIANPLSVRARQQDYPDELSRYHAHLRGTNLNRVWPGRADGNPLEQVAYALWNSVVRPADCVVDLHAWRTQSMAMVAAEERDRELARVFGHRLFILQTRHAGRDTGHLSWACHEAGVPCVIAELPPQNTLDESAIALGVRGLRNLLVHLGMAEGEVELPAQQLWVNADSVEHQLTAEGPGLLVPLLPTDTMLARGDLIAVLVSLDTLEVVQEIRSPVDGLLFNVGLYRLEGLADTAIATGGETVALVKEVTVV